MLLEALADRTPEERAVLKVLAEVGTPVNSSKLRVATEQAYGVTLNEKSFPEGSESACRGGVHQIQGSRRELVAGCARAASPQGRDHPAH